MLQPDKIRFQFPCWSADQQYLEMLRMMADRDDDIASLLPSSPL
jgi:hypothetical protein